jgi:integrase
VPLTNRAIEILRSLPRVTDNPHVFPGQRRGAGLSNMAMLELMRDMRPGITVHGFRSTFRTWTAERTGLPGEVAEAALAHTISSKVEAAYQRGDMFDKRRRLMEAWAQFCAAGGADAHGRVVALRREHETVA